MMHARTTLIGALALMLALPACTTRTSGGRVSRSEEDLRAADRALHLYRVEIDEAAVRRGARLLFTEPPPQHEFGLARRAQGYFNVSDRGFCRVVVRVGEPVVGVGGRRSEQIYTLIEFFGKISDDGTRATIMSGEDVSQPSSLRTSEVRFTDRGDDKVTIQAFRNGHPDAYRFHFARTGLSRANVPFPWSVKQ